MSIKIAGKLFTQRRFLPFFILFQAGTFNDNALKNALIGLVTFGGVVLFSDAIPRTSVVPIAALLFTMPFLILSAIAGQIADKYDRGLVLKVIKRLEMVIMIIAAIGFFLQSAAILAFTLVLMGSQSAFFSPTKNAVLPTWLADEELITGNGLLSGFQFFFILLGQSVGLLLILMAFPEGQFITGPRLVGIILLVLAFLGWLAAEQVPSAPAPAPDLKINYNPITATWHVLKTAWGHKPVFRPLLGIAWFYGLSAIFVTAFPIYVADVMHYDQNVLTAILVVTTLGILTGSLLCIVLARGKEAMGVCAAGIIGVTIFSLDLYLSSAPTDRALKSGLDVFWAASETPRFLIDVIGASVSAGLFVIPLQAMAQRRSDPKIRARLMAAGSVLLNLSVNSFTFVLVYLGYKNFSPAFPFLLITIISSVVTAYALYRLYKIKNGEGQ